MSHRPLRLCAPYFYPDCGGCRVTGIPTATQSENEIGKRYCYLGVAAGHDMDEDAANIVNHGQKMREHTMALVAGLLMGVMDRNREIFAPDVSLQGTEQGREA